MGDCVFCGKPAGLFKSRHQECMLADERAQQLRRDEESAREKAQATEDIERKTAKAAAEKVHHDLVQGLMLDAYLTVKNGGDLVALDGRLIDAISDGWIAHQQKTEMLISAYEMSVEAFLDDGVLDAEEEDKLVKCQDRFALSQAQLDRNGKFLRVAKSAILRRVLQGEVPANVDVDAGGVVNFQKGETPVWLFNDCEYLEDVVRKQFVGRSQGMSFRVMSGVYYRVGGFKGEPVTSVERKSLGSGALVVTDQNLYFVGPNKTTRIPYKKVVSFTPHSDAVGVMRDTATAKPQFFVVGDPWFAFNLITNLAKIHG